MGGQTLVFTVFWEGAPDERPALAGSGPLLGDWQRYLPMEPFPDGTCRWRLEIRPPSSFTYKFVLLDAGTGQLRCWEEGPDHLYDADGGAVRRVTLIPRFQGRPPWRKAGVAVPVFSLRSRQDFGVGSFADLKPLADWAAAAGLGVIQVLPVCDTCATFTRADSYPYSAVSAFALHPMYLQLPQRFTAGEASLRTALDDLPSVDYDRMIAAKMRLLRAAYAADGAETSARASYARFIEENAHWLRPYAAFCILRDRFGTADFSRWGEDARFDPDRVSALLGQEASEAGFHYFTQYHLDVQLREAADYAHRKGILLKGDLPIGVGRFSADAWQHPDLFNLDFQAGAPPDYFSADGQTWGFPTYNWEAMAADGYAWWKARLRQMSRYFDAFRIDHILGFFRIWEVPAGASSARAGHFSPALPLAGEALAAEGFPLRDGLFVEDPRRKGTFHPRIDAQASPAYRRLSTERRKAFDALSEDYFYHRHDAFWREGALRKLPALLDAAPMLACGEDLGMIPDCVPGVMRCAHILSLEVQRMPKAFGKEFAAPSDYPYESVCTTGSHDTSTLRGWWEENPDRSRRYWTEVLGGKGDPPARLGAEQVRQIVQAHLASPSALCILPIQDWWGMDADLTPGGDPAHERINDPADPHHYWRWRMHLSLEDLCADATFIPMVRAMVRASGR